MTLQAPAIPGASIARGDTSEAGLAARHRRAPGPARLRTGDVRLHLLALLQSRARQRLIHGDGVVARERPRVVVAHPHSQRDALHRGGHSFFARTLGGLSAPAFPLHCH